MLKALFALILVVSLFIFYFYSKNLSKEKIRIAIPPFASSLLPIVAHHEGFFNQVGLDVELVYLPYGVDCMEALKQGKVDYAIAYTTPFVLSVIDGYDFRAITHIHRARRNTVVVYKKSPTIKNFTDLKSKTIAIIEDTNAEFFLNAMATVNFMKLSDFNILNYPSQDITTILNKENVDAVVAWQPLGATLASEEPKKYGVFNSNLYSDYSMIISSKTNLQVLNTQSEKLLLALLNAQDFFEQKPDDAKNSVATVLSLENSENLKAMWKDMAFQVGFTNTFTLMLDAEIQWAGKKISDRIPSAELFLDKSFLLKVAPESIHINEKVF